jgi:hypothetical protein
MTADPYAVQLAALDRWAELHPQPTALYIREIRRSEALLFAGDHMARALQWITKQPRERHGGIVRIEMPSQRLTDAAQAVGEWQDTARAAA